MTSRHRNQLTICNKTCTCNGGFNRIEGGQRDEGGARIAGYNLPF